MLEKSETGVRVFWMDQFSAGFDTVRSGGFVSSPDVTGRLDAEILEIGSNTTSVWRLSPDMAANVAIDLDIDADGVPDFQVPATVEVEDPDHSF